MDNKNRDNASPWLRLLAHCIDSGINWLIFFFLILNLVQQKDIPEVLNSILFTIIIAIFLGLVASFIAAFFDNKFGGSPGMLITAIGIYDKNGNYLSFKRAWFRRVIGNTVSGAILWMGYVWIFIDKEHRGWHDLISSSWVRVKSRTGFLPALLFLTILLVLNITIVSRIVSSVKSNLPSYKQTLKDLQQEFTPDPLKTTNPDNVNNFFGLPTVLPTPTGTSTVQWNKIPTT